MTTSPSLPIGYWLKQADRRLTQRIDAAQQANGLSRVAWQVLNSLSCTETMPESQLAALMQPFVDQAGLWVVLKSLEARRQIASVGSNAGSNEPRYSLTSIGTEVHAKAQAVQVEIRHIALDGISQDQYEIAVCVLARIVSNLG